MSVFGFCLRPAGAHCVSDDYGATDERFDVAAEKALGRIPVLLVRMNADLLLGEELKKTGAGNLCTVFGDSAVARTRTPPEEGAPRPTSTKTRGRRSIAPPPRPFPVPSTGRIAVR